MRPTPLAISNRRRLEAVAATGLIDTPPEEAFDSLTRLAQTVLQTPFAFLHIVDSNRSFFKSFTGLAAEDVPALGLPIEASFCQYVIGSGAEVIIGDVASSPISFDNPSIENQGVRAWAGFPLRGQDNEIVGTLCVVDSCVRNWTARDVEVLRTLARSATSEIALRAALSNANAFAATLQTSLLPPLFTKIPALDVGACYQPAGDGAGVMGDFFDVFEAGGRWFVVVGDVCGHGVAAAQTALLARWTIRATAQRTNDPSEILSELNALLLRETSLEDPFMTAQVAVVQAVDPSGFVAIAIASAGHPLPVLRRVAGQVDEIEVKGQMLGVFERLTVPTTTLSLAAGDAIAFYTDGISEARQGSRLFGSSAIMNILKSWPDEKSAAAIARAVVDGAVAFTSTAITDDMAVLVFRREIS